jgi:hypothetical protein
VLGGSVALLFCFEGKDRLVERLAAAEKLEGMSIRVRCLALGGYKQPQQLMTLAYHLVLEQRLDLVVSIDGFNEVALPWVDNYHQEVSPLYPRSWKQRVETIPDPRGQHLLGRLVCVRDHRVALARFVSGSPLELSVSANLLWKALDRVEASRMARAETALAEYDPQGSRYRWQGPASDSHSAEEKFVELARLWHSSSLQLHRLCQANGIRYIHVLHPNQYVEGSKPLTSEERRSAFEPGSETAFAVRAGYPLLSEAGRALRQQGVEFHDFTHLFNDVDETLYVDACCHFNARGSQLLADALADAVIQDRVPDPRPPQGPGHHPGPALAPALRTPALTSSATGR